MQLDIAHVARYVASFCSQLYIYCTYIIHVARYEFCQKYSTIPLIMLPTEHRSFILEQPCPVISAIPCLFCFTEIAL